MGKQPEYDYTPDEIRQYQDQLSMKESQLNNGLYAQLNQNDMASTREFYLSYEDVIFEQVQTWRGKIKEDGNWVDPDPEHPGSARIMSEEAISVLIGMMRSFLSTPNRLANQEEDFISTYAFQARKHISKFLHTVGWLRYRIPVEYLGLISFQSGQTIHAALTWSKNAGGQRFMTRSIISHENTNQLISRSNRDEKKPEAKRPW